MGTIHNDTTLDKLRDAAAGPKAVRKCVSKGCGKLAAHSEHDEDSSSPHAHAFVDPAGEPIFVLRGQDMTAANVVAYWLAHQGNNLPREKYDEAQRLIEEMRAWPRKKPAD
jgi:hypothetical protein